jgi:hypothetical protein
VCRLHCWWLRILPQSVGAPPVCAGQLNLLVASTRPNAKVRGQESEATMHTEIWPDRDTAAARQFSYWPCHILSWARPPASLVGIHHDPPGSPDSSRSGTERRQLTRHLYTAWSQAWSSLTFSLSLLTSSAPSSSGNTAGTVFLPLAVSHCSLSLPRSPTNCRRNRPGWVRKPSTWLTQLVR